MTFVWSPGPQVLNSDCSFTPKKANQQGENMTYEMGKKNVYHSKLVNKMCKELLQINFLKANKPAYKWAKILNRYFSK